MLSDGLRQTIQQGYSKFLEARDLKPRLGQKQMVAAVANTLTREEPGSRLCAIEAGTGTGKTVGYLISALPIARELNKTVVVSTATIALQEQLLHKDIPDLLKACDWDYSFALVKGRGRYACTLRLEQILDTVKTRAAGLFLFDDEIAFKPGQQTENLYRELYEALEDGSWDGQRDGWETSIHDSEWIPLTVDRRSCAGRRCRHINQCPFYTARAELEEADCIVANHDLVMADLALGGGAILPPPEDCIYIFDEGHRLGEITVRHFAASCRINGTISWLERLQKQCKGQAPLFEKDPSVVEQLAAIEKDAGQIADALVPLYPQMQRLVDQSERDDGRYRFTGGDVGEGIREQAGQLTMQLARWQGRLDVLVDSLDKALAEQHFPVPAPDVELLYQQAGSWQSRAENLTALWDRLRKPPPADAPPLACWLKVDDAEGGNLDISLHASPIQGAEILSEVLWNACYGAVLTSATLRALGRFDNLQRETGLPAETHFLAVSGAFDYQNAAVLRVPKEVPEGNQVDAHSDYIVDNIESLIEKRTGTLVLFSSRRQMEQVYDQLSEELRRIILIQGQYSNREMVRLHKERIDQGKTSALFGLASFAEGVDLPGGYCSHVIIAKLPFAVPDDPLHEALSEFIENRGGNAFFDMSLPQASLRLVQAVGRLLRTESDTGTVTILDKRLVSKRYGRNLLDGLPAFRREL